MGVVFRIVLLSLVLKGCAVADHSERDVSHSTGHQTPTACGTYFDLTDDAAGAGMKFLLHVVSCLGWKSMTVISDGTPGMAGTVFTQYLPSDVVRMIFQLHNPSEFTDWFKGIMSAEILSTNFVVLGNSTFLRRVFSEDGRLTLKTIVRRGDATSLSFITQWCPLKNSSLLNLTDDMVFPNVKYGLGGRTLKMVTMPWTPFITRHQNNGYTWYSGLCMDLLKVLSSKLNFTYTIIESTDGYWGSLLPNGTWAGMIGMLHRKEVDFALAGLSVTADRSTVADYTLGFYFDEMVMIARWPDPMPLGWTFYIRPFHWHVYLLLGSCMVFITVVLVCLERLYARTYNRRRGGPFHRNVPFIAKSVLEVAETLFGAFIGRAVIYEGVSNSGRLLLSSWLLLSLVTIASYTGKLISNSVVVQQPLPFNTLAELVQRTDYKWGFGKGTMLDTVFAESNDPYYKVFYQKMLQFAEDDPDVTATDLNTKGLAKILNGQFVRVTSYSGYQHLAGEHCELTTGKERLFHDTLAIYLQKKSPYLDKFNEILIQASESGLLYYLARKWLPDNSACKSEETTVAPVTVELMQSAFVLALAGLVLAFVFLVLERLSKCRKAS